jgi:uncharacterized protein YktA (UPF0223 family)
VGNDPDTWVIFQPPDQKHASCVATRAPYGYKKDENDPKRKIIPDEDAVPVVQRIFSLCAGGKGPSQIARQLKKEQILTPGNYYYHKTGVLLTGVDTTMPYDWSNTTVASILEDEVYLGHTISLQSTTISYKNKKRIERPKAEQLRFENTHEPLVTKETWDIVQNIRKHKRRRANMAEQNMFSGLVYCADCGGTMVLHRAHTMDALKLSISLNGFHGTMLIRSHSHKFMQFYRFHLKLFYSHCKRKYFVCQRNLISVFY